MEELEIQIIDMELKEESLRVEVDRLNDYGNTPEGNYYRIHQVLTEWIKIKAIIKTLREVLEAIKSNKEFPTT